MIPKSGVRFSDQIMRNKEGGGAPKGASNHGRAISGARQRAKQTRPAQVSVRRSPALPGRAHLPALHRGTSPTARLISGPRFLELPGANGRTLPGASAASTSRTGRSAGRDDARSRPGADWQFRPRGPLPLHPSGMPSGKASQVSEIRWMYSKRGRVSRARHDRGDTISPLPAWGKGRPSSYPCRPAGPARISAQNTLYFEPGA